MRALEIHLPDEVAMKLQRAAEEKGIRLDELVRASVEEKLARDEQFDVAPRSMNRSA